ncbi:MAG: dTMP kinase [Coriobacteriia bacterium]|nr:dTMP kinase [Coriobacteriia bacterium]
MSSGKLITFEGIDGVGKSTQIELVQQYLEEMGYEVLVLREPGGTQVGEAIREVLLSKDFSSMSNRAELLLYEASRAQLVDEVIKPQLELGTIVILDRFFDSSLAYQGYGRGFPLELVEAFNFFASDNLVPDLTILLDMDGALDRALMNHEADRLEASGHSFIEKVREGFLALAQKEDRIELVDAQGSRAEVFDRIKEKLNKIGLQ